ncbi:MAG: 2-amino-4-hydroxy-6-hydroxymethyldihydropteridine diphosphokinase [Proteobacteria bacterium]|nr:2-amino-4-hydroxy-6-hydroxymethyldihydropteridine diphosphokinase [Pseudomonadota bacterium]
MNDVLIGLGGNIGDVEITFLRAKSLLGSDLFDTRMSRIYRSAARYDKPGAVVPAEPAPDYFNAVLRGCTYWSPQELLVRLLEVEKALGRVRPAPECSPRAIDLDLLLYGDRVISPDSASDLTVPHPRMHLRDFVLVPACEVAPDWVHPVLGATLSALLPAETSLSLVP